jgi:hypothetical protein
VASNGMIFKPSFMKIGQLKSYCGGGGGPQTHNSFLLIFFCSLFYDTVSAARLLVSVFPSEIQDVN